MHISDRAHICDDTTETEEGIFESLKHLNTIKNTVITYYKDEAMSIIENSSKCKEQIYNGTPDRY